MTQVIRMLEIQQSRFLTVVAHIFEAATQKNEARESHVQGLSG